MTDLTQCHNDSVKRSSDILGLLHAIAYTTKYINEFFIDKQNMCSLKNWIFSSEIFKMLFAGNITSNKIHFFVGQILLVTLPATKFIFCGADFAGNITSNKLHFFTWQILLVTLPAKCTWEKNSIFFVEKSDLLHIFKNDREY